MEVNDKVVTIDPLSNLPLYKTRFLLLRPGIHDNNHRLTPGGAYQCFLMGQIFMDSGIGIDEVFSSDAAVANGSANEFTRAYNPPGSYDRIRGDERLNDIRLTNYFVRDAIETYMKHFPVSYELASREILFKSKTGREILRKRGEAVYFALQAIAFRRTAKTILVCAHNLDIHAFLAKARNTNIEPDIYIKPAQFVKIVYDHNKRQDKGELPFGEPIWQKDLPWLKT